MKITAKGAAVEAKRLERLSRDVEKVAKTALKTAGPEWKAEASGYYSGGSSYRVPPPPRSRYKRTGNYGRSTRLTYLDGGLTARITSSAARRGREYARYVGGDDVGAGQAGVHAGRWPVIFSAAEKNAKRAEAFIKQALGDAL